MAVPAGRFAGSPFVPRGAREMERAWRATFERGARYTLPGLANARSVIMPNGPRFDGRVSRMILLDARGPMVRTGWWRSVLLFALVGGGCATTYKDFKPSNVGEGEGVA